jgi:hypothetical protein
MLLYVVDDGSNELNIVSLDAENKIQTVKNLLTNFEGILMPLNF